MRNAIKLALGAVTLFVVFAGFSLAAPANPASSTPTTFTCRSYNYPTAEKAKENYHHRCTIRFQETTAFRCDWEPRGWYCSGPGHTNGSSSGSDSGGTF